MKIKAAILRQSGLPRPYSKSKPLLIEEVELDPPNADEVLIKVKAVGLCHSDLVAISGERGKPMPIVLGHEAAGIITAVGDHVKGDSSSANGLVKTVNSTVMTINGSFGTWTTEDNVQDITSGVANTANVTGVSVTTTGANGIISTFTNSNAKVSTSPVHKLTTFVMIIITILI